MSLQRCFCAMAFALASCIAGTDVRAAAQPPAAGVVQEALNRIGADLFSPSPHAAEAIKELKAILAAEPGIAEAHFLLGVAYRLEGTPEMIGEAVAELRQAVALKPSLLIARLTLARVYLEMARASRAREELEAAAAQAPGRPEILSLLGEAERQLGNPQRSAELNRQALQTDESFAQARYYLGLALLDLRQPAEAIREMQLVVKSGVNPVEAHLGLGTAYLEAGRAEEALPALREAARLDPARAETRIQLARVYRAKGLLEQAEKELKLAAPSAKSGLNALYRGIEADLYMEEGLVRMQQGRLEAAAESFQRVLAANAGHEAAKQRLAEVRKRLEERAKKKAGAPQ